MTDTRSPGTQCIIILAGLSDLLRRPNLPEDAADVALDLTFRYCQLWQGISGGKESPAEAMRRIGGKP